MNHPLPWVDLETNSDGPPTAVGGFRNQLRWTTHCRGWDKNHLDPTAVGGIKKPTPMNPPLPWVGFRNRLDPPTAVGFSEFLCKATAHYWGRRRLSPNRVDHYCQNCQY